MKFSMTGKEKGDLLIEVSVWAGLIVCVIYILFVQKKTVQKISIVYKESNRNILKETIIFTLTKSFFFKFCLLIITHKKVLDFHYIPLYY